MELPSLFLCPRLNLIFVFIVNVLSFFWAGWSLGLNLGPHSMLPESRWVKASSVLVSHSLRPLPLWKSFEVWASEGPSKPWSSSTLGPLTCETIPSLDRVGLAAQGPQPWTGFPSQMAGWAVSLSLCNSWGWGINTDVMAEL